MIAPRIRRSIGCPRPCRLAGTLWLFGALAARAAGDLDTLLAPPPAAAGRDGAVQPAALVTEHAVGSDAPAGPVPLHGAPLDAAGHATGATAVTTANTSAAGPALSDWRVIAALGAAFAVLASLRLFTRRAAAVPPPDVFEVLGGAPLVGQHAVKILRFGPKTLLVGVSAAGCTTLAEISDPQATACIAAACRGIQRPSRVARSTRPGPPGTAAVPSATAAPAPSPGDAA